jgi:hypothetical protein
MIDRTHLSPPFRSEGVAVRDARGIICFCHTAAMAAAIAAALDYGVPRMRTPEQEAIDREARRYAAENFS